MKLFLRPCYYNFLIFAQESGRPEEGCVHHFKLNYLLLCGNAFAHSNNSLKCAYLTREKEEKGIFILNPLRVKRRERVHLGFA